MYLNLEISYEYICDIFADKKTYPTKMAENYEFNYSHKLHITRSDLVYYLCMHK